MRVCPTCHHQLTEEECFYQFFTKNLKFKLCSQCYPKFENGLQEIIFRLMEQKTGTIPSNTQPKQNKHQPLQF